MTQQRPKIVPNESLHKLDAKNKRFLAASLILHVVLAIILFSSWHLTEPMKLKDLPSSIQARVLSAAELQQLTDKKAAEQKAIEKKKQQERDKKLKEKKAKEAKRLKKEQEKKKAEQKRREQEKMKADAKRKEEARKKALVAKKEEEKKKAEQKRKEAEQKKKEQQARADEIKRLEREQQLAERLKAADQRAAEQERLAKQRAMEELLSSQRQARQTKELEEKERFMILIRNKIESRWHIPPKIRNQSVLLRIRLLPNGELASVKIIEASSSSALDQSAINAVQGILKFPVPEDKAIFEKFFRQFTMRFSPELR